jgi:hypothetical protein
MTSHQSDHENDEEGAPVAGAESQTTLDAETLQQWQLELDGFVVQIRGRLQPLSESLTHWRNAQRSIALHPGAMADQSATPLDQTTDAVTDPPEFPESEWVAEEPLKPSLDPDLANDADPLERLKLRLAKQIENA